MYKLIIQWKKFTNYASIENFSPLGLIESEAVAAAGAIGESKMDLQQVKIKISYIA